MYLFYAVILLITLYAFKKIYIYYASPSLNMIITDLCLELYSILLYHVSFKGTKTNKAILGGFWTPQSGIFLLKKMLIWSGPGPL